MSTIVSAIENPLGFEYVFCPEDKCPESGDHIGRAPAHHLRLFRHNDRPEGWTAEESLARAIEDEARALNPEPPVEVGGVGTVVA